MSEPAELSFEAAVAHVEAGDSAHKRHDLAFDEVVIEYAASLPKRTLPLQRLVNRLRVAGVKIREWTGAVNRRRDERAKEERARSGAASRREERPVIITNAGEPYEVNEAAVEALAALPYVFQRLGFLVRVIETDRKRPGEPIAKKIEVRLILEALLREYLTRAASWFEERTNEETGVPERKKCLPPAFCTQAILQWVKWPHVRPLHHVAEIPVLLQDGSLVATPGYDEASGMYYAPKIEVPAIPEVPTQEEARAAAEYILDLVCQFPFETPARRSAWLAALLTPIARWAFDGQAPLFMFDANQSASGKGELLKVIGRINLGREMDVVLPTQDEEEERKRITSKILAGTSMVNIDNIDKSFGSAALEALLTTGTWSDRLLGTNEAPSLDAWITWYGSGNNVQFKRKDTRRRVCVVRILTEEENPEERTGFKYDLDVDVLEMRPKLVAAALTMLRAWIRTGQKARDLPDWGGTWGSFNGWDQVVRGAIVYAGLEDPIGAKGTRDTVATEDSALLDLLVGLEEAAAQLVKGGEFTAAQVHEALEENDEFRRIDKMTGVRFKKLRSAMSNLMPGLKRGELPTAGKIGSLLGRSKGRPCGGKRIAVRVLDGNNLWRVEKVPEPQRKVAAPDEERAAIEAEALEAGTGGPNGCPFPDCDCDPCRNGHCTARTPAEAGCSC